MSNIYVIIPSSGEGSRFGSSGPKQLHILNDEPILIKTHNIFNIPEITAIFISVNQTIKKNITDLKLRFNSKSEILETGGNSRSETVLKTLIHVSSFAKPDDWIIVHDAVRPFLDQDTLKKFIKTIEATEFGGIMGFPVVETVKLVDNNLRVSETIDRTKVWLAQTPQMFPFHLLKKALQEFKGIPTDECQAIEALGYKPTIFMGDAKNIKITYQKDLFI
jgi:2-C-methyl-D-erythritol 4-phosphate cytidylyltransferase